MQMQIGEPLHWRVIEPKGEPSDAQGKLQYPRIVCGWPDCATPVAEITGDVAVFHPALVRGPDGYWALSKRARKAWQEYKRQRGRWEDFQPYARHARPLRSGGLRGVDAARLVVRLEDVRFVCPRCGARNGPPPEHLC